MYMLLLAMIDDLNSQKYDKMWAQSFLIRSLNNLYSHGLLIKHFTWYQEKKFK